MRSDFAALGATRARPGARCERAGSSLKTSRRAVDADPVIEVLLVIGAVAGLASVALLGALVAPATLLYTGGVITCVGLAAGVPTGFWYHVALYRALRPRGALPARWWLHPVPLHSRLQEDERSGVLRWFVLGGIGFGVVVIGCGTVVLGLLVAFLGDPPAV
jgi:hypothetical protein